MAYAFNQAMSERGKTVDEVMMEVADSLEELEVAASGSVGFSRNSFFGSGVEVNPFTGKVEAVLLNVDLLALKADQDGLYVEAMILGVKKGAGSFSGGAGVMANSRLEFDLVASAKGCVPYAVCGSASARLSINKSVRNAATAGRNLQRMTTPIVIDDGSQSPGVIFPWRCAIFQDSCR